MLHLALDTSVGTPAWKPLPVLVTTPLALFGSAAPALWLVFARAAGLMALWLAFRSGRRLTGPWAGALAALFVALTTAWVRALEHGYTEPLMVALALGALERHLAGRRLQALALGALVCLGRPEAFAFLLLYAAWSWRVLAHKRAIALVAVVPALWLGGDWWGAGDPFHARHVAGDAAARFSGWEAIGAVGSLAGPLLVAAALVGWWAHRSDHGARALAGGALAWTVLLAAMAGAGYPGSDRFMVLPAAAVCVLAGAGAVEAARAVAARRERPVVRMALVAGLAAVALLYLPPRIDSVPRDVRMAEARARSQEELRALVRSDPESCGTALLPPSLDWNAGAVAWDRNEPLERVGNSVTGAEALSDGGPHVDLVAGRDRDTYGLRLPPGAGGEVYVPARDRPIEPHVSDGSGLGARLDAVRGRWAEVDVCRTHRGQPSRITRGTSARLPATVAG